jgi:hypothetical protein
MIRRAAALLVLLLAAPMAASAQVYVAPAAPGPVVVVRPPVRHYHAWWRVKRFFWPQRHTVVVVPGCPTCCCPSPHPVAPPPPPPPPAPPAPPAPDIYAPLPPLPPPPPPLPPPPPAPRYYAPRYYAPPPAPVPTVVAPLPQAEEPLKWFGIGVRGGLTAVQGGEQYLGIGGHLRLRPSKHFALDLAAERMSSRKGEVHRIDVPVTLGGQFYILHGTVAPFLVADIGVNFARASAEGYTLSSEAKQLVGRVGGGIELRLGRHVTLSADARYVARQRFDKEKDVLVPAGGQTADGTYFAPTSPKIGNEHGAEFRLIGTVYF